MPKLDNREMVERRKAQAEALLELTRIMGATNVRIGMLSYSINKAGLTPEDIMVTELDRLIDAATNARKVFAPLAAGRTLKGVRIADNGSGRRPAAKGKKG